MPPTDPPEVPGVLSAAEVDATARAIARAQEPSGAIPWFPGGHTDPWDHVESAMALTAAGRYDEAAAAYAWCRRTQRADGSWPAKIVGGRVEDAVTDTNFCAYVAVGVWHHLIATGDEEFAAAMWPVVRAAVDLVLDGQRERGELVWARGPAGWADEALLSGCSSIHQSLRCALALAEYVERPQPDWEVALGRLVHTLRAHPEAFADKDRYSMDWYYPVLGGAVRGRSGLDRIHRRWPDFVVDGLGVRCVADRPWVTGAETCELVLSLDALGRRGPAREMLAAMQHLRESDGSYWTGYVYADGKRWPEERTTWTGAAVVLAADALAGTSATSGIFRGDAPPAALPAGLPIGGNDCGCDAYVTGVPG